MAMYFGYIKPTTVPFGLFNITYIDISNSMELVWHLFRNLSQRRAIIFKRSDEN